MEIQYGISIKNKYDLFLENDDPLEVLQQQEELKNAAKKSVKIKKKVTEKEVKSKKKDKPQVVQSKSSASAQESNDKDSAPADNQKKQKTEGQVKPLKDRGNRPPQKSDFQTDPSLKSGKDDSKPAEPSQRKFGSRVFGNRRGAQNGERRGFGNNSDNKNLENQENLDRTGQEGRRFGGNKFGRPEGGEGNQKFGNGFAESRTFRGRGGRRGFNRPRGTFRGGRGFGKPEGDRDEFQKSDEQPPKTSEGEIGHWENEGEGEKKNDQGPGYRGKRDFGWRGRGRGRGGFGRRDKHDGARGTPRSTEKKDGSGSHNWGTVMDDIEAQKEENLETTAASAPPATTITNTKTSWADMTEAAEEEAAQNGENVDGLVTDGGSNLMTLDEYKAAEEGKRVKAGFNIRKPNEGCNTDGWNSFVLKKKSQEEQDHEETEEDRQNKMQKGLKDHHKVSLEIPIMFADSRRMGNNAGGGRGGPGRRTGGRNFEGRGRGGEGSFNKRGGRGGGPKRTPKERAPDVADERLFPSLSSTTPQ